MLWHIGIDEAGYGPILGPFVMTAVAIGSRLPMSADDFWHHLPRVCRNYAASQNKATKSDEALFWVVDSKQLHRGDQALARLEYHTLPALWPWVGRTRRLGTLLRCLRAAKITGLQLPCYRVVGRVLPLCHPAETIAARATLWQEMFTCAELTFLPPRVVVFLPQTINQLLERHGTKAALPLEALRHLLPAILNDIAALERRAPLSIDIAAAGEHPVEYEVVCDRLGGRVCYATVLTAVLEGWQLQSYRESPACCEYLWTSRSAEGRQPSPRQRLRFVITPCAESQAFAVALASMMSKYLREVFMDFWNEYWQQQVPHVRPTAGYWTDGERFLRAIRPAYVRLGLPESALRRFR
ncbi:MAG: hypothetical protein RMI91_12210 [Gemmatales bacterium]|nr:hypothetical protein [Gemmatales bacterium]